MREAAGTVDSDKATPMQPNPAQSEEVRNFATRNSASLPKSKGTAKSSPFGTARHLGSNNRGRPKTSPGSARVTAVNYER